MAATLTIKSLMKKAINNELTLTISELEDLPDLFEANELNWDWTNKKVWVKRVNKVFTWGG